MVVLGVVPPHCPPPPPPPPVRKIDASGVEHAHERAVGRHALDT